MGLSKFSVRPLEVRELSPAPEPGDRLGNNEVDALVESEVLLLPLMADLMEAIEDAEKGDSSCLKVDGTADGLGKDAAWRYSAGREGAPFVVEAVAAV